MKVPIPIDMDRYRHVGTVQWGLLFLVSRFVVFEPEHRASVGLANVGLPRNALNHALMNVMDE